MNTNKEAGAETGPKCFRPQILAFTLSAFKAAVVTLTLWHKLPGRLAARLPCSSRARP